MGGDLPLVGYVQFRPLGQSHYLPAPWQDDPNTAYLPSVMSERALRLGIQKARGPLPSPIPEERYQKLFAYMAMRLAPIWAGDNFMSYEEAVSRLNFEKSPGYPLYFECEDKACALTCHGGEIMLWVRAVIAGKEMWLPSTLTLKDELRTADRVKQEKTRVFSASGMTSLIAAKMLFDKQNDKLRQNLGKHPLTIGIPVPGPYFVKTVLGVSQEKNVTESDIDGCDQRYPLQLARLVRDLRKLSLPAEYHDCVDLLYDEDFCGDVIAEGCVYRMYGNKSGRNNTGDDNGLMQWAVAADYVLATTNCDVREVDSYFNGLFNGDDGVTAWWEPCTAVGWKQHAKDAFGVIIELGSMEPVYSSEVTFLSHHLRARYVPGMGDVMVAAGNRGKLLASKQWIKRNAQVTFEENCLAHLLGLRICLWPWRDDFMEIEELINQYIDSVERTPQLDNLLKARIPEPQIINLHTRLEAGFSGFFPALANMLTSCDDGVRDLIISAIREVGCQMATVTVKELARRKAQSKKDKMQAKAKPAKKHSEMNSGVKKEKVTMAPVAKGYDTSAKFVKKYGGRFKDMITIEGDDHLEFVVSPSDAGDNVVGQVLNEIYVSPSEFGGTRLEKYAALYEKFRFTKLEFEYIPSAASTDRGDVILAYDRDISDPTPPATEQGLRQFTGFEGSVDGNIWTRKVCKAKLECPDAGYYTNPVTTGDDRLAYQGQFYVAIVSPLSVAAGTTIGRIRLHYRCEFYVPQLEGTQNSAQMVTAFPSSPVGQLNADFYQLLNNNGNTPIEGVTQWKPQQDPNSGAFYIKLAQGVYKLLRSIKPSDASGQTATSGGNGQIDPSTVEPLEPMPASAPQPWTATVDGAQGYTETDENFQSTWLDELIGVPRGGAKVYGTFDLPALTDGFGSVDWSMNLQRISNYINEPPNGVYAWYHGNECRAPKKFTAQAKERAAKKHPVRKGKGAIVPATKKLSAPEVPSDRLFATRDGTGGSKDNAEPKRADPRFAPPIEQINLQKFDEAAKKHPPQNEAQARTRDMIRDLIKDGMPLDVLYEYFRQECMKDEAKK